MMSHDESEHFRVEERPVYRDSLLRTIYCESLERRDGLVVRVLDFGSSGPSSIPRPGRHVVSLGKTLCSLSASSSRIRT